MRAFFDSNVAIYLLSDDVRKATVAEDLFSEGGTISVQVLNEFVSVARRKYKTSWRAIEATLAALRTVCRVDALTLAVQDRAFGISRRHGLGIHDSTIVASALAAKADTLYTEDLQHGQKIEGLLVENPFRLA